MNGTTLILFIEIVIAVIAIGVIIVIMTISRKTIKSKLETAEADAKAITSKANAEANEIKFNASKEVASFREALNKEKDEWHNKKAEIEERNLEVKNKELIVSNKKEELDKKSEILENKLAANEAKEAELTSLHDQAIKKLESISSYTKQEAKEIVFNEAKDAIKEELGKWIVEQEEESKEKASARAIELMTDIMPKYAQDVVSEKAASIVNIPNDDVKGKIIGREGRNIRAFEAATGVDLIVDDTPNVITVSCFDPIRREIAKRALDKLIKDGRIQPQSIEDEVKKIKSTMDEEFIKTANETLYELGIHKMPHELKKLIGILKYRTSYGQNALVHSKEVASLSGLMAAECGQNVTLAKRAGLLHDIGKALDFEHEGTHIELGAEICKKHNEHAFVINGIETHHGTKPSIGIIPTLITAADALSAARPGARRQSMEQYVERIRKLEDIAKDFKEVKEVFAVKAGREVRVIVMPEKANDSRCVVIAREIKDRIENELQYPGNVIVNVIRETRHTQIAQ